VVLYMIPLFYARFIDSQEIKVVCVHFDYRLFNSPVRSTVRHIRQRAVHPADSRGAHVICHGRLIGGILLQPDPVPMLDEFRVDQVFISVVR
jgi:hypothetical protein